MAGPIGAIFKAFIAQKIAKKKKKFGDIKERFGALGKGDIGTALIGTENRNLLSQALKKKKRPGRVNRRNT